MGHVVKKSGVRDAKKEGAYLLKFSKTAGLTSFPKDRMSALGAESGISLAEAIRLLRKTGFI